MVRHDLVFLHPDAAFRFACGAADPALTAAVREWIEAGRPLVTARQPAGSAEAVLGLALPLAQARRRVTCLVERRAIARVAPPLAPLRCLARLPADQAEVLAILDKSLNAVGVRVGVYGSLAWEAVSGEAYRTSDSDIDLVCDVHTLAQYHAALQFLEAAAARLSCRLDGEVRFPDGHAVAWRELLAHPEDLGAVLAKGPAEVRLMPVADLLDSLGAEAGHA